MKDILKLSSKVFIVGMIVGVGQKALAQPSLAPPPATITGITELSVDEPTENTLEQNAPNPSVGFTNIQFSLKESGSASLKLYDATGKLVATVLNENLAAGTRSYQLATRQFPEGIYFYQLSLNQKLVSTKRLVVLNQ